MVIIGDRACRRWTGRNTVDVNVEYQSFKVVFTLNLGTSNNNIIIVIWHTASKNCPKVQNT